MSEADLVQEFKAWVSTKPADEEYDFLNSHGKCAFGQFLSETGKIKNPYVGLRLYGDFTGLNSEIAALPVCLLNLLGSKPVNAFEEAAFGSWFVEADINTFGELAERLETV